MKYLAIVLAAAMLWAGVGCKDGGTAGTTQTAATQGAGNSTQNASGETPVKAGPRVVSTVPAATLMLVQMGAVESLVGVTKYDELHLPESKKGANAIPVVGDYMTMNYETLIRLKPTALVIQTAEHRIEPRLKELSAARGFEIVNIKLDSLEDLWRTAERLGKISGKEAGAALQVNLAKAELAEIAEKVKGRAKPKVMYVIGDRPMMVVGGKTFLDEMIGLAGGENLGAKAGDYWPVVGQETLIRWAPEVILVGAPGEPAQVVEDRRLEGYMKLSVPAAKAGRVFLVTDAGGHMLSLSVAKQVRELNRLMFVGQGEGQ